MYNFQIEIQHSSCDGSHSLFKAYLQVKKIAINDKTGVCYENVKFSTKIHKNNTSIWNRYDSELKVLLREFIRNEKDNGNNLTKIL